MQRYGICLIITLESPILWIGYDLAYWYNTQTFCSNYCNLNDVTKLDYIPLQHKIMLTKWGLLKSYWQDPLWEVVAFIMSFGPQNALMSDENGCYLEGCSVNLDAVDLYLDDRFVTLDHIKNLFDYLAHIFNCYPHQAWVHQGLLFGLCVGAKKSVCKLWEGASYWCLMLHLWLKRVAFCS